MRRSRHRQRPLRPRSQTEERSARRPSAAPRKQAAESGGKRKRPIVDEPAPAAAPAAATGGSGGVGGAANPDSRILDIVTRNGKRLRTWMEVSLGVGRSEVRNVGARQPWVSNNAFVRFVLV